MKRRANEWKLAHSENNESNVDAQGALHTPKTVFIIVACYISLLRIPDKH